MELMAFLLACVAIAIAHSKQRQIDVLLRRLENLEALTKKPAPQAAPATQRASVVTASPIAEPQPETEIAEPIWRAPPPPPPAEPQEPASAEPEHPTPPPRPPRPAFDLEKIIGVHLPVWGGAAMLLIAGFFLARMAADNGFFTPLLGVSASAFGAFLMLLAAILVRWRRIANHGLIASGLASAAIGTLYATSFLSSAGFGLTSLFNGFLLSAGTAALALAIAFVFGRPVLIVGLVGGYLVPFFLLDSVPDFLLIYLYLTALLAGGVGTCLYHGWRQPFMAIISLHYVWMAGLVMVTVGLDQPHWASAVILLVVPIVIFALEKSSPDQAHPSQLSLALSLLLLVGGGAVTGFALPYLLGFGALAIAAGGMALRATTTYPTIATAIAWLLMLVLWRVEPDTGRLILTLVVLGAIIVPLLPRLLRGLQSPTLSAVISIVTGASFVATMVDFDGTIGVRDMPLLWAALALAFAAVAISCAVVFGRRAPQEQQDQVRGIFAAAASGYLSLAIVAIIDPGFFALAAALQVLGLAIIHHRYRVPALYQIAGIYTAIYFAVLFVLPAIPFTTRIDLALTAYLPTAWPWDIPVQALLLPALAFLAAATVFLLRSAMSPLVRILDFAGVIFLAWGTVALLLFSPMPFQAENTLWWTSVLGNPVLLIALAAYRVGQLRDRPSLLPPAVLLFCLALLAIFTTTVLPVFDFWPVWQVQGLPVFNVALTGLVLPGAFAFAVSWSLRSHPRQILRWAAAIVGGVLVLSGLLVDIRHLFHPDLLQGQSGPFERYAYSAGMLAAAFTALALGARLDSQPLRYGSLAIMLATVGKVFLFDVGGLEGIWRVASFVAMGIALLATSWFYGRFVFNKRPTTEAAPA